MKNDEMMTLNLRRIDVCNVRMAITSLICDLNCEMSDPATTDDRKKVLRSSIDKWSNLYANIRDQFVEQDI